VISSRVGGPPREQGSGWRPDRAAVSDRIPVTIAGEVGQEQRLGQHGNVGNLIEASRGGVAHRRGVLIGGGGSAEEFTGARLEERRVAPGVGLVGTGASWWSSGTGRRHRMLTCCCDLWRNEM
jgi:hypothetical protein